MSQERIEQTPKAPRTQLLAALARIGGAMRTAPSDGRPALLELPMLGFNHPYRALDHVLMPPHKSWPHAQPASEEYGNMTVGRLSVLAFEVAAPWIRAYGDGVGEGLLAVNLAVDSEGEAQASIMETDALAAVMRADTIDLGGTVRRIDTASAKSTELTLDSFSEDVVIGLTGLAVRLGDAAVAYIQAPDTVDLYPYAMGHSIR